jgi:hypothetical protein
VDTGFTCKLQVKIFRRLARKIAYVKYVVRWLSTPVEMKLFHRTSLICYQCFSIHFLCVFSRVELCSNCCFVCMPVCFVHELVSLRDNKLEMNKLYFSREELDNLVKVVCIC